jgi:hypothetical protein
MLIQLSSLLDALSCIVMMLCLVPVAAIISPREHGWYTAATLAVSLMLLVQFLSLFDPESLPVPWATASFHAVAAMVVLGARKRMWLFVRVELGAAAQRNERRRTTDVEGMIRS